MRMPAYGELERSRFHHKYSKGRRSIGTYNWDPVVELEYPAAFQKALLNVLDVKKTFRYVYLGGAFTEPDQEKSLWFYSNGRRVRVRPHLFPSSLSHCPLGGMLTFLRGLRKRIY